MRDLARRICDRAPADVWTSDAAGLREETHFRLVVLDLLALENFANAVVHHDRLLEAAGAALERREDQAAVRGVVLVRHHRPLDEGLGTAHLRPR